MKKYLLSFLVLITLLICPSLVVSANVTTKDRLNDDAKLFSWGESSDIKDKLKELSELYDADIIVATTKDPALPEVDLEDLELGEINLEQASLKETATEEPDIDEPVVEERKPQFSKSKRVMDYAALFTKEEFKDIAKQVNALSKQYKLDIVVITTNDILGDGSYADFDASLERFHDENGYDRDSVFLGINMDPDNREVIVQAYGKSQKYIPDEVAYNITESMVSDLKAQKYAKATNTFIKRANNRLSILLEPFERKLPKIEKGDYLIDDAHILTNEQKQIYLNKLFKKNENHDIDLYVITLDEFDSYSSLSGYVDTLADENGLNDNVGILAILLGDAHREVVMAGYGEKNTRSYLTDARCQNITDSLTDDLAAAKYTDALDTYLSQAGMYVTMKELPVPLSVILTELFISAMLGVIYVCILIYNASAHSKATRHTYQEPGSAQVLARIDNYTHTTVTKTKIESSSSSGSRSHSSHGRSRVGGGGHSHGGSRHSSGRSRF